MAGGLSLGFGLGLPFARAGLDISLSNRGIDDTASPGATVGALSLRNAGGSWTYSMLDNAGGRFAINASTGVISVAHGALLDYEAAASQAITVRTSDQSGHVFDRNFTVAVTNGPSSQGNTVPWW